MNFYPLGGKIDVSENEVSKGLRLWYPSFLRRNLPTHPPSLAPWSRFSLGGSRLDRGEYSTGRAELQRVRHAHSSTGIGLFDGELTAEPWSSAKADKARKEF